MDILWTYLKPYRYGTLLCDVTAADRGAMRSGGTAAHFASMDAAQYGQTRKLREIRIGPLPQENGRLNRRWHALHFPASARAKTAHATIAAPAIIIAAPPSVTFIGSGMTMAPSANRSVALVAIHQPAPARNSTVPTRTRMKVIRLI
ncbi:MAG: hypothetical protein ACO1QR_15395 [Chthoniobacteraceae bacterium]